MRLIAKKSGQLAKALFHFQPPRELTLAALEHLGRQQFAAFVWRRTAHHPLVMR